MILYYTGTGNSRHIAELLARGLSDSLYCINDGLRANRYPDLTLEDKLIFSVPTYACDYRVWLATGSEPETVFPVNRLGSL